MMPLENGGCEKGFSHQHLRVSSPPVARLWNRWTVAESLAVFALGAVLMHFMYSGTGGILGDELGVPDHDSFYHIKMAAMIPQHGLVKEFPWLQFAYFTRAGHAFVSHHYGFHIMMVPFVKVSEWLYGDWLPGGRAMNCLVFGAVAMLFNLLLISEGVRWRGVWLLLFLLLPHQFFGRQAFVRAIGPSLAFMLLLLLLMFRRRYVWAGLVMALYIHLYLGAVMYGPVIVIAYVLSAALGPRGDREIPWRPASFTFAGWLLGILTHPYRNGIFYFLRMQVFGTGLSPDIEVGLEWLPYEGHWWWAQMCGPLLVAWIIAVCVRFRTGPPLNARALCLLLLNFAFAVLNFKSRRFIEYWPLMCLLSAAYLLAPTTQRVSAWWPRIYLRHWAPATTVVVVALGLLWFKAVRAPGVAALLVEWQAWAALAAALMAVPLARAWLTSPEQRTRGQWLIEAPLLLVWGAAVVGVLALVARAYFRISPTADARLLGSVGWLVVLGFYAAVAVAMSFRAAFRHLGSGESPAEPLTTHLADPPWRNSPLTRFRLWRTLGVLAAGIGTLGFFLWQGADQWVNLRRSTRCGYNLPAVRAAMDYLKQNSAAGDVVFTDDWDVFCAYFYYNTHNYYIVGLDPKFTHERRPDLWERYVKITRAQVPADARVKMGVNSDGTPIHETIHVRLEDIRDHFGAKYVVIDHEHKHFAAKLAQAPHLAKLVYPSDSYAKSRNDPYLIFRIRASDEPIVPAEPLTVPTEGPLYLSTLTPLWVEQGWGDLTADRTVEGGVIMLGEKTYPRGLGTHAPSKLRYAIPAGYSAFEAVVGIDRDTEGRGSAVVSVYLDGRRAFESPVLTGRSLPVAIRIPLEGAKELLLQADPTSDGDRFDHADWADARLVRDSPSP